MAHRSCPERSGRHSLFRAGPITSKMKPAAVNREQAASQDPEIARLHRVHGSKRCKSSSCSCASRNRWPGLVDLDGRPWPDQQPRRWCVSPAISTKIGGDPKRPGLSQHLAGAAAGERHNTLSLPRAFNARETLKPCRPSQDRSKLAQNVVELNAGADSVRSRRGWVSA